MSPGGGTAAVRGHDRPRRSPGGPVLGGACACGVAAGAGEGVCPGAGGARPCRGPSVPRPGAPRGAPSRKDGRGEERDALHRAAHPAGRTRRGAIAARPTAGGSGKAAEPFACALERGSLATARPKITVGLGRLGTGTRGVPALLLGLGALPSFPTIWGRIWGCPAPPRRGGSPPVLGQLERDCPFAAPRTNEEQLLLLLRPPRPPCGEHAGPRLHLLAGPPGRPASPPCLAGAAQRAGWVSGCGAPAPSGSLGMLF